MITLASDFGFVYPTVMRGVVLSQTDGRLVDVAHDLPQQDVRTVAFWLRETLPYLPPTAHLAAVDPGVGIDRRVIVLRVGDHVFVGPDNGILRPSMRHVAAEPDGGAPVEAHEIDVPNPESTAFHGWGIFAPAAADAHVADVSALGLVDRLEPTPVGSLSGRRLSEATVSDDGREATGEVLAVDDFGNCITSVLGVLIRDTAGETVRVNGESVPVGRTFEAVARGEELVTVGNHGNVRYDVDHGRGSEAFGLAPGDRVEPRVN